MSEEIHHLRLTQQQIDQRLSTMQSDILEQMRAELKDWQADKDEQVVTTTEEFDTSQPVDTLTGTPPLKSRSTEQRRTISHEQEQTAAATATQQTTASTVDVQEQTQTAINESTDTRTDVEVKERFGMTWLQRTLCYIGIAALVAVLLWVAWRLIKRYLTII